MDVAERAAENEGESDGGEREAIAQAQQDDEDDQRGQEREGDQAPAHSVGRGGVGEEREGRALVGPVRDAQDAAE